MIARIVIVNKLSEKASFAFSKSFFLFYMAITVDAPVENNTDIANTKLIKGIEIFTEARANSPTPLLTNIPSTIVYSEKTHMATTEGPKYLRNCLNKLFDILSLYTSIS